MGSPEYDRYDGLGLAELVSEKQVSAKEIVEDAIHRIEERNPELNAVTAKFYESALQEAENIKGDGLFSGVPFLMKEVGPAVAKVPLTQGSRFLRDYIPPGDSELVTRYRRAGLIICGKTNAPEFGLAPTTEPELFGPTRNPWDPARTPGGSSGGAAAAVAAEMVPMAHGNDGGGSIRVPAACCGLFGLKPTRGRTPAGPYSVEEWRGLAVEHAITRSVRDSAALLDISSGPDIGAPYYPPPPVRPFLEEVTTRPGKLRIAFSAEPSVPVPVDPECRQAVENAAALCAELGHEVEEACPRVDGWELFQNLLVVVSVATEAMVKRAAAEIGRRPYRGDLEIFTRMMCLISRSYRAGDYEVAFWKLGSIGREISKFFENYDILVTPILAQPPIELGTYAPSGTLKALAEFLVFSRAGWFFKLASILRRATATGMRLAPYTPLHNVTGHPAMSVPLYWTPDSLPIGVQFAGRYGDEATLFRLAGQLEEARPWADKRPKL